MKKLKCKFCKKEIKNPYHATQKFCNADCRNANHKKKYGNVWQRDYNYQRMQTDTRGKIQCRICGRYYRQVGSHIVQIHKITARDYRAEYGFDIKRGQLPPDFRKLKAKQAFECGGVKNLKKGKKFWFVKGDKKAGKYKRSQQTMERLKNLNKLTKVYARKNLHKV